MAASVEMSPPRAPRSTEADADTAVSTALELSSDVSPGRYAGSLAHGLSLLRCFSPEEPVLGIAELSERAELARGSTHRYVRTLVELGYLEQRASRKYRLGRQAQNLGLAAVRCCGLGELARPWLAWLRARTGFTASLAMLDGEDVVYIAWLPSRLQGQAEPAAALRAGCSAAPHACAAGMALLAYAAQEDWPQCTCVHARRTPKAHRRLLEQLGGVCERGYAVSKRSAGVSGDGVAVAVLGASEAIAAVELTVFGDQADVVDLRGLSGVVVEAARGIAEQVEEESRAVA